MWSSVFLAMISLGFSNIAGGSSAVRCVSASSDILIPGAIAPPMYSPSLLMTSNVVAVPKLTTKAGRSEKVYGGVRIDDSIDAYRFGTIHFQGGLIWF